MKRWVGMRSGIVLVLGAVKMRSDNLALVG